MPQNTNLNVSPYFDDFVDSKNYHKVLFKPGFPVQARELTTLQSILQNQIEKFGQHFFKEGSMIIPGGTFYDDRYFAVKIDPNFLNIPVNVYTKFLADNKIEIRGETSGVEATVVNRITAQESIDGFDTLYVKYTKSGSNGTSKVFQDGENLITLSTINYLNTSISTNSQFARTIVSGSTATGSSFSVNEGVYFIRGFFVKTNASTVILDQYSNLPSYRVGFLLKEETIGPSSVNSDLYDNAKGFSNEAAPGADRFRFSTTLHKKSLDDIEDLNFVELLRVESGIVREMVTKTEYNIFARELARRTYDESGDYYIRPFSVNVRESLNDRLGNRGIYFDTQKTQNGNTPSDDIISLQVSSGKAYVRGYEVDKFSTSSIDVFKPRETKLVENQSVPIRIGNSLTITNVVGSPTVGFSNDAKFKLLSRRLDDLKSVSAGHASVGNNIIIGDARSFDYSRKTAVGVAVSSFDLKFYDLQLYTVLTVANNFSATSIQIPADAHVKGKYSGSVGYAVEAKNSGNSLSLRDVTGDFQLNEPLIINGNESGNNITAIVDNSFEDIKAVHSSDGIGSGNTTFAADTLLDRTKKSFAESIEFTISGGNTLKSPQVADFRGQLKIGDIVSYGTAGQNDPTFNRVTSVDQTEVGLAQVADVPSVCDGSVNNVTISGLNVVIPTLTRGDDPGFRIKLADRFISSMNTLDSSYITRKQGTKNNFSNATVEFNISDMSSGDTTDLFFEPFTSSNYTLELQTSSDFGKVEELFAPMVNVDTGGKTVTISGLSVAGGSGTSAVLTAAVKRTSISSKEKSLVRCNVVDVVNSSDASSGITTLTKNDGLTVSNVYGTRVQDNEISLNVPEATRVLAVLESDSKLDPTLPTIGVSNQSDTFTNNVLVGEQFIGNRSGAVARVVVVGATQLSFVYENDVTFEIGENITLRTSGILATITTLVPGSRNIKDNYTLDDGQRLEFADFSRIVRKANTENPTRKLKIVFDNLLNSESTGNVETVNSYVTLNYSKDIPFVVDRYASDFIDFRPRVAPYTGGSNSPFSYASRSFNSSQSESIVSNESVVVDYSYYQGRIDRLYLTKDGIFTVKEGKSARTPRLPLPNEEAFEVASISYPPYVRNANQEVVVKTIPHKRYTMKDIGGLEHRIKNLENYTTLSLLETDTKNLSIKDPNTGLDKFKSGFFVDNFRNHVSHNLTGDSKFDIDLERSECRPRSTERNVGLIYETKSTISNPVTTDYRWTEDFVDGNLKRGGPALTLDYTEVEFLSQPFATTTENLNPFHIALYAGSIELNPESDFWIEEVPLGAPDIFKIDSAYNAMAQLLGVPEEQRENGGMASSFWNSHEQTWNGKDSAALVGEELIGSTIISENTDVEHLTGNGQRQITTTTTELLNTIEQTFEETGIEKTFGLELTPNDQVIDLGNKVVGVDVLYNLRSRNIEVVGKRLKPNTRYYVFMENIDMTAYAVPKLLPITMDRGTFATNDIVESTNPAGSATASILFRVASANHKFGPYNDATATYATEPYDRTPLSDVYSSTSTILNVDTGGLAFHTAVDHLGWVKKGMKLVNKDGDAEATVGDLSLVTNEKGELIFSLHIPDPKNAGNPLFSTGNNTIRLTTSETNSNQMLPGESSAEAEYLANGYQTNTQEQTLSIRSPNIERKQIGSDQPISRLFNRIREEEETRTNIHDTGWYDPLAQSFLVERDQYQDGIFITGGELYFRTKDNNVPVTVQLRTMRDGSPTTTILPFGTTQIEPEDVNLSEDSSAATSFKFNTPVYLQSGYEYCIVLIAPTEKYNTFITRMGEEDLILQSVSNQQPYLGSLFKSQNSSTWDPSQFEDLKFKLNKAKFVTNTPSSILLYNQELPLQKIQKVNPVIGFSKRVSINITNDANTGHWNLGDKVTQIVNNFTNTGRVSKIGGKLSLGDTKLTVVSNTGIGLTDGTYVGVTLSSLTGKGEGAVADITVEDGAITAGVTTITTAGKGYSANDLLVANKIGETGSGAQFVVTNTSSIVGVDFFDLDDVKDNFVSTQDILHTRNTGQVDTIAQNDVISVNEDSIRDGRTLKFDHRNHGMHSSTNKLRVSNFHPDTTPVTLSQKIDDDTNTISISSGIGFTNFESASVGIGTSGFILIDKEIIAYNSISGNDLTDLKRGVDSSLKSNHSENALVYKYEFNGVSLTKINKEHDIDPREKTFDSYHVKIPNTPTDISFNTTKVGGGSELHISQNIPFEVVDPRITSMTPTGTDVTARIKTTSGTSMSGNEASFTDLGYENIALNKLNYLDSPRLIASKVNESGILSNQKSFGLELTLNTIQEDVSPVVDLDTLNVIAISNLVDSNVSNFEEDNRPRLSGLDPNTAIYETKIINLEFVSNSLFVQFDGHREAEGDIRVFYKLFRSDSDPKNRTYIPFNGDGSSDKIVESNSSRDGFSEYKFTAENTAQFNAFMIKVVLISTNQAKPPRIKNFRSIALRSFEVE